MAHTDDTGRELRLLTQRVEILEKQIKHASEVREDIKEWLEILKERTSHLPPDVRQPPFHFSPNWKAVDPTTPQDPCGIDPECG